MKFLKSFIIISLVFVMLISAAACGKNGTETTAEKTLATTPATEPATPEPTTTEPEETLPTEPLVSAVDILSSYYSTGENNGWSFYIYSLGETNTGKQYIRLKVTPTIEKIDGSIDFADSTKEVQGFDDLSIMVRMNAEGFFDVRNGDAFEKLAEVAYSANNTYMVEIEADMDGKTYTVYVTAPEGERTRIADNYSFRTTANDADDLGKLFLVSAGGDELFYIENVKRLASFESGKAYISKGENFGWQQNGIYPGQVYTGKLKIDWDMTCLVEGIDGSIDFTDIDIDVFGFGDLAMLVRMAGDFGYFDVRNYDQGQQCLVQVPYSQDVKYHLEIECDMDAGLYSCWVTPPDGERTKIAEDYRFRVTAAHAKNVGQVYVISRHASDQIKLENLVITPLQ